MGRWWNGYPWRVIQTNMREIDMADLDAERFVADLESFHANMVMLNAAGLVASYPSELADQPRSRFLTGDSLQKLVELCRAKGIKVIARTDFSKISMEVFQRHPDWAYRTPEGNILEINGSVQTCISGGYQNGYMDKILEELLTTIHFDGLYCNMGGSMIVDYDCKLYGPCHCENCKKKFREQYGFEIPESNMPGMAPKDAAGVAYGKFTKENAAAHKKRVTELLRRLDPDLAYCSVDYVREESNTEYGRSLPHWQYSSASNTRTMRGMGEEATSASVDFMGFSMRHASITPALHQLRLWQALANFGGIDFFVMGRLDQRKDHATDAMVKDIFAFAAKHEELLYGVSSCAGTLLVRDNYKIPNPEERGWIRTLTEQHIPFDETLTAGLGKMDLSSYRLVILPNKARLPAAVCDKLNAFAQGGGCVLSVGRPPVSDKGEPLACLGVREVGKQDGGALGATVEIRPEEQTLFHNLTGRSVVPVAKTYVPLTMAEQAKLYMTYMPAEPFGPPEYCYPHAEPVSSRFGVSVFPWGEGKGVCVPFNPGTPYYQDGYDIWRLFMADVLEQFCGVESIGPALTPMVEVTWGRKGETQLVHLVNGTGHFGTTYFPPVSLQGQTVEIPWAGGEPVCESLYTPGNVTFTLADGKLRLTVENLGAYECIAIRRKA